MNERENAYAGLRDGRWETRRESVAWLLKHPDPADLERLLPLLHDPRAKVRQFVVVTLALAHGTTVDVVPRLIERAHADESLRVRRHAVSLLAWALPHPDLEGFFAGLVERESDAKLLRYARAGIVLCRGRAERASC